MRIVIAGASGFLGTALATRLETDGHEVRRLRRGSDGEWDPSAGTLDVSAIEGADAIVNLAGRTIGKRLTTRERRRVTTGRVVGTQLLAESVAGLERPPGVLINASAVGYYGDRGAQVLNEDAGPGHGFLAELCRSWEASTEPARDAGVRVVILRTGIVLGFGGPLFNRLLPAFRFGLGGRLGDGTQYQPWITLNDHVRAVRFALTSDIAGPLNLAAPNPVTNAELVRAIGRAMHRPSIMVVPRSGMRLALGRALADDLLASQRAVPAALSSAGFGFEEPSLDGALATMFA